MQQAVHVLYGTASPAEALQAANVPEGRLDLNAFLSHVAANAHFAGIANVVYEGGSGGGNRDVTGAVIVRADEFALEDVVTHILRNADSYRPAGTAITLSLSASESAASATLHNQGATIAEDLLERIFELGVSAPQEPAAAGSAEHRGQGLFVARTYMAKMGGTIKAHNTRDGVAFTLTFQRLG
nr:ATP-binding protein [Delftia acidovorans]